MNHKGVKKRNYKKNKTKLSTRTQLIYENSLGVRRNFGNHFNTDTCEGSLNSTHYLDSIDSSPISSKSESPLPPGADGETVQELLSIKHLFSDSDEEIFNIRPKRSENSNTTNNCVDLREKRGIELDVYQEEVITNKVDGQVINSYVENKQQELPSRNDSRSTVQHNNSITSNGEFEVSDIRMTPNPSPVCQSHHAESDVDCSNQFCPFFTENVNEIQSHVSSPMYTNSLLSTPQANTPLSCSSSNLSTPASSKRRKCGNRKDKGNIRRRHVNEWIDNKRKTLRNSGKEYESRNGTIRPAKNIGPSCPQTCRMKCFTKISDDQRQQIFDTFWALGDRSKQWGYIAQLATRKNKRRVYTDTESKRKYTITYKLPSNPDGNNVLTHTEVCKKMFLGTFSVSEQLVYTAIGKVNPLTGVMAGDLRGKHGNHPIKITEEIKESVCAHIKSLKPVEGHLIRKDSDKLYLDGNLTFPRLFELYVEWVALKPYTCRAQTERQYQDIVNENFKISLHIPKKDQCDTCHIFENLENPSSAQKTNHETHINDKTLARELKSQEKQEAKASNGKVITASFDFQKILNAPHGDIGILYYKRKLSVFNFTVFSLGEKEGTCYMWHEGLGKRGANEVASCLLDYIANKVDKGSVEFRFWSDNCVGQNRNRIVYIFYVYAALKYKVKITHSFLVKGHTQAESDSVHAAIEKAAKNKLIYTPAEWYSLVRWTKKEGLPYNVKELDYSDFFDFKLLLEGRNWNMNIRGEKVAWNKIRKVEIDPDNPYKIRYKYSLSDEYSLISITTNTRAKNKSVPLSQIPLYLNPLLIPKAKIADLMSLCDTGIIPKSYSGFFKSLKVSESDEPDSNNDSE